MATKKQRFGTKAGNGIATILKFAFCAWPIALGVWMGVASSQTSVPHEQATDWLTISTNAAIAVMGAGFFHLVVHSLADRHFLKAVIWAPPYLLCLVAGLFVAITTVSTAGDHLRDQNATKMVSAGIVLSNMVSLPERKAAQVATITEPFKSRMVRNLGIKILPEEIVSSIETKIGRYKEEGSGHLKYTSNCRKIYDEARDFCDGLNELNAKRDAARERDKIQGEIDKPQQNVDAPSTIDSFADVGAFLLNALGYKGFVAEEGKDAKLEEARLKKAKLELGHAKDLQKAVVLVMIEQLGPTALWMLLLKLGSRRVEEAQPKRKLQPQYKAIEPTPGMTVAPPVIDPYLSFVQRRLERCEGAKKILSRAMYQIWCEDCAIRGVDAGTYQLFGRRLKKYIDHDPGSHPGWLNVRIKEARAEHAPLRLAVNNA